MFEVKNFDNWIEDKVSGKFGSGASEKIWLVNPETNEKGLFPVNAMTISPLYDNGSSLCSYIIENDIETILKDKMKYEAIINTKSKSAIG